MPSVTLPESAKLAQDMLVAGVIEDIITLNPMFDLIPFDTLDGNSLQVNREDTLGDVIVAGVGTSFSGAGAGKNPSTFNSVNFNLTTIMGDAEVNGLIQATRSGDGNDQTMTQIAGKAKSTGRKFQDMFINGTGAGDEFNGLINLCAAGQTVDTGVNGSALTFELLDELMDTVVDKDGQVDYITMHARTLRSYKTLLRAQGGATISETVTLPSGTDVYGYNGTPILRNDYIPVTQTKGASTNTTTIFAGNFDDGTRNVGLAGMNAPGAEAAGIVVEDAGLHDDRDEHIWRIKWYCGLALFSEKGLACADGITN